MDLSKIDLTASADVAQKLVLTHPATGDDLLDKDGNVVYIELLGRDSTVAKAESKRRSQQMLNQMRGNKKVDVDEAVKNSISLLSKLTLGWSGLDFDGEELEFSREKAIWLYTEYSWIREQVDEFIADRSNFFKG